MVIPGRVTRRATRSTLPSDEPNVLIARVAEGDEKAFGQLYDYIAGPILGIVTRVLRDHARAEEVAQEVLFEIWLKAEAFGQRDGNVMSWALTIAHRRAVDRVRSERAAAEREDRAEQLEPRRPVDEVVETTLARLEQQQVKDALAGLTDLQRESIILAYYEGYSYRQVAEALDAPLGTIKTRMRDGLLRLSEYLGAQ